MGFSSPNLKIYAGKTNNMTQVWDSLSNLKRSSGYRRRWIHCKASLSALTNFQVRFDAIRPSHYSSAVSLDDIVFENCLPPVSADPETGTCDGMDFKCNNGKCIPGNLRCDYNNDCLDNSDELYCDAFVARCNFSASTCNDWSLEPDGAAKWVRQMARGNTFVNIPSTDHTTGTSDGQFLSVLGSYKKKDLLPKLVSPTVNDYGSGECMVRFWYNFVNGPSKIYVYKRVSYGTGGMKFLGEISSDTAVLDYWYRVEVQVRDDAVDRSDFQVVLSAYVSSYSSVNIDDISMTKDCHRTGNDLPGKPSTPPPTDDCGDGRFKCKNGNGCYSHFQRCNFIDDCGDNTDEADCGTNCTFESGYCGWYNAPYSAFDWIIKQGKENVKSFIDIPKVDRTLNTSEGHFLSAKGTTRPKDVAQIITKSYIKSGGKCRMEFWYFMDSRIRSKNVGTLSVFLMQSLKGDKHHELISMSNRTDWNYTSVSIGTQERFSIGLEAISGSFSYIAVDDITFKECALTDPPVECSYDEWMCVEGTQCIKVYQHCDGKPDCIDKSDEFGCQPLYGDCFFDSEKWLEECNWQYKDLDFNWTRSNQRRNDDTGPVSSKTPLLSSYFLYIDSSKQPEEARAGVMTPVFKASQGKCHLRFWYTMYGSPSMGSLEVFSEGINGQVFPVWYRKGPQKERDWQYAHAEVGNADDYRISFVATRGGDDKTDIAIDEVHFTLGCEEGGPAIVPNGTYCAFDEFRCKSGKVKCVLRKYLCDCDWDCADGSDEMNCAISCSSTGGPKEMSTKPTTTEEPFETVLPRAHCEKGEHLCKDQITCIQGLLLCDGVKDCPDGSDETSGCRYGNLCREGYYFCSDKAYPPCIKRSQLCDGKDDCRDGSDETLCDKCPENFCKNDGNCSISNRKPICTCKQGYLQNRCARTGLEIDNEDLLRSKQAGAGMIVGVVIGTILVIAIGVVVWYKRYTNAERARLPHAVDNPVYGLNLDTLTFGELNSHMPVRNVDGAGATAIENPLYAFKSDIK